MPPQSRGWPHVRLVPAAASIEWLVDVRHPHVVLKKVSEALKGWTGHGGQDSAPRLSMPRDVSSPCSVWESYNPSTLTPDGTLSRYPSRHVRGPVADWRGRHGGGLPRPRHATRT